MLVRREILERWWQEGRRCCGWFLWLLRGGCVAVTRKGRVFVMGLLGWLEQGLLANGHGGGMGVKVTVFVGRMRSWVAVAVAVAGIAVDGGAAGENGGTAVFGRKQRTTIGGGLGWVSGFSLKRWDGDGGLWWFGRRVSVEISW
ncbi:hypothetical protein D5086_008892 [Populus alba]|uniref:Uncharacterized protein n=1 Tax=Populus alba TaxID=43335 RepID=A0ACC4CI94_POPAL